MQADFQIMGVLNLTPDSFSDGGRFNNLDLGLEQAKKMLAQGAEIIDIGGESTRPGAVPVSVEEELSRVLPTIKAIRKQHPETLISIDTHKTEVMEAAIHCGAGLINDINALQADGAIEVAVKHDVKVCLMHKQGTPQDMQDNPQYQDVVQTVLDFFDERVEQCLAAGMNPERIILDPGIGFGKNLAHNIALLQNIDTLKQMGFPVLIGVSRKSMFAEILQQPVEQRLFGSLAAAQFAYLQGADIFRVHDVSETRQVLYTSQYLTGKQ